MILKKLKFSFFFKTLKNKFEKVRNFFASKILTIKRKMLMAQPYISHQPKYYIRFSKRRMSSLFNIFVKKIKTFHLKMKWYFHLNLWNAYDIIDAEENKNTEIKVIKIYGLVHFTIWQTRIARICMHDIVT